MASESEDFILRLREQISGPAKVATTAMAQLEAKILAEQTALSGLEAKMAGAAAKLRELGEGHGGSVNIKAFRKQQDAVAALQAQIERQKAGVGALEGARGLAAEADAQKAAAAAAKEKAVADAAAAAASAAARQKLISAAQQEAAAHAAARAAAAASDAEAEAQFERLSAAYQKAETARKLAEQQTAAKGKIADDKRAEAAAVEAASNAIRRAAASDEAAYQAALRKQKEYSDGLKAQQRRAEELMASQDKARKSLEQKSKATKEGAINFGELGESLGKFGGPAGAAGARVGQLTQAFQKLGALGPAGIVAAIVVAVIALTAAIGVGLVALTKWVVGLADTARNGKLATEGLAASHKALANIATILPAVHARTGLAAEEIARLAESLAAAGVSAENMEGALTALATAKAGGASTAFVQKLEAALKATGRVPPELAAQMSKFEDIARRKMLSLDAQSARLKKSWGALFADLKIEAFLAGLSKIVGLLDKNTASGKALKFIIDKLFQPLIDAATASLPFVEAMFLGMVLAALKLYVALKPVGQVIASMFGSMDPGTVAVLARGFAALGMAIVGVISPALTMLAFLSSLASKLSAIGSTMMTSLANGITAGAGAVLAALTGVVGGAIGAAKSLLGIASPSKVFAEMGAQTGAGFESGVEDGAPAAQGAMKSMVAPPAGAPMGAPGGGKSELVFSFVNCVFGEGMSESIVRDMFTRVLVDMRQDAEPVGAEP